MIGTIDSFVPTAAAVANQRGVKLKILVFPSWYAGTLPLAIKAVLKARSKAAGHSITWMCSAPREVKMLRLLGQRAVWCHHNLFCNEVVFDVQSRPKSFDALYVARLDDYKRVWLASKVKKLRIITANPKDKDRLVGWGCAHAELNEQFLALDQIAEEVNKSGCCLALSAREGGMFATTEYLLCGKPVVSTRSQGGRDVWYTKDNHILTEATPEAVADAVNTLNGATIDRQGIRAKAIEMQRMHRKTLQDVVEKHCGRKVFDVDSIDGDWILKQFIGRKDLQANGFTFRDYTPCSARAMSSSR